MKGKGGHYLLGYVSGALGLAAGIIVMVVNIKAALQHTVAYLDIS